MPTCHYLPFLFLGAVLPAAPPVHLGGAVHLDLPASDLKTDLNGKLGVGGSFQVSLETGRATMLRLRADLDHLRVSNYKRPGSNYREETSLNSVGLGADLLLYPGGDRDRGLYGLAGAGVQQWFQSFTASDYSNSSSTSSSERRTNRFSPWGALGLGWQFTPRFGAEAREVLSSYDSPQTQGLQSLAADVPTERRNALVTQLAFTFRF
jgi:hypothetical protein